MSVLITDDGPNRGDRRMAVIDELVNEAFPGHTLKNGSFPLQVFFNSFV